MCLALAMSAPSKNMKFEDARPTFTCNNEGWAAMCRMNRRFPLAINCNGGTGVLFARVLWMTDIYRACGLCHIKTSGRQHFEAKWIREVEPRYVKSAPMIKIFDPVLIERSSSAPKDRRSDPECTVGYYSGSSSTAGNFYTQPFIIRCFMLLF